MERQVGQAERQHHRVRRVAERDERDGRERDADERAGGKQHAHDAQRCAAAPAPSAPIASHAAMAAAISAQRRHGADTSAISGRLQARPRAIALI